MVMERANSDKQKYNLGIELTSSNINDFFDLQEGKMVDPSVPIFIFAYSETCGYCSRAKPEWSLFVDEHKDDLNIGYLHCFDYDVREICSNL